MKLERERRFICNWNPIRDQVEPRRIRQAYLTKKSNKNSIRVRIIDDKEAILTIKGDSVEENFAKVRPEWEYPIPLDEAKELVKHCVGSQIIKDRYILSGHENHGVWEINEYSGDNSGIILAEIEMDDNICEKYDYHWLGEEVTRDSKYSDVYLANNPGWFNDEGLFTKTNLVRLFN